MRLEVGDKISISGQEWRITGIDDEGGCNVEQRTYIAVRGAYLKYSAALYYRERWLHEQGITPDVPREWVDAWT